MVREGMPMETAVSTVTSNVAAILALHSKGAIAEGKDADLVILNGSLMPHTVAAMGVLMMRDGKLLKKGNYGDA